MKYYKNWEYKGMTPAHGMKYHHKTRKTVLIVYNGWIRLYNFYSLKANLEMYPVYADELLERKIRY